MPVLVLTGDVTPEAKERALSRGANDFISKPLNLTEVQLRVRNLLQTRHLHLQLKAQNRHLRETPAQIVQSEKMASLGQLGQGNSSGLATIPAFTGFDDHARDLRLAKVQRPVRALSRMRSHRQEGLSGVNRRWEAAACKGAK